MSKFKLTTKKHSKSGTIAFQVRKINEKIDEGNFKLALKMIRDNLVDYPEDYGLLRCLIRVYTNSAMYDEALDLLNTLDESFVYIKKIQIYLIKDDYDEVKRLYTTYYDKMIDSRVKNEQINLIYYIVLGYLGLSISEDEYNKLGYGLKQAYAYSKQSAVDHIYERHVIYNDKNENEYEQALFNTNVNIAEIFDEIEKYVKCNKDKIRLTSASMHLSVKYQEAGLISQGVKNYIEVICQIGTGDILTMYPVKERGSETISYNEILEFNKNYENSSYNLIKNAKKH